MNKKRIIVAGGLAILMIPVMVAGFLYRVVEAYFIVGKEMCDNVVEQLGDYLSRGEK